MPQNFLARIAALMTTMSPDFSRLLGQRLVANAVIFDVGCFRGQYTRNLIKSCAHGDSFRVFMFDGNPASNPHIQDLLSEQISFNCIALSDTNGELPFYINTLIPSSGTGLSELVKNSTWSKSRGLLAKVLLMIPKGTDGAAMFEKTTVKAQTLDSFVTEHSIERINLLKIDVEGSECNVLEGAKDSLSRGIIDAIQIEILDSKKTHAEKCARIYGYLGKYSFNLYSQKTIHSVGLLSNIRADEALFVRDQIHS
jgi:FkbM family methyltransferase